MQIKDNSHPDGKLRSEAGRKDGMARKAFMPAALLYHFVGPSRFVYSFNRLNIQNITVTRELNELCHLPRGRRGARRVWNTVVVSSSLGPI
jgi:hypothetical protein